MSVVYVFSDPHFGHKNMATRRGFKNVEDMDELIVTMWNMTVKKNDIVWLLGDITMEKADYGILDRLAGHKRVILGNHDNRRHVRELLKYVDSVSGLVKKTIRPSSTRVWLTHAPIHTHELESARNIRYNVHGHVHEHTLDDPRYINVSAENIDYTPQLLTKLIQDRDGDISRRSTV